MNTDRDRSSTGPSDEERDLTMRRMPNAVMEVVRAIRADDRLYDNKGASPMRRKILKQHIVDVAESWNVPCDLLTRRLIEALALKH